jgi:hypothetical protein
MSGPAVLKLSAWEQVLAWQKLSVYYLRKLAEWYWHDDAEKTKELNKNTQKKQFLNLLSIFQIVYGKVLFLHLELKPKRNGLIYRKCNYKIIKSVDKRFFSSQRKSTLKKNL